MSTSSIDKKPGFGLGRVGLIFACGTALFSDGYQNGVIGTVNTLIKKIYKDRTDLNLTHYSTVFSSLAFAGTLCGMLVFGLLSDRIGRKFGMIFATVIVFVFAALSAGAYGAGGSISGMLAALSAYRFLIGIGIGAEYPAGSVAASENTEDPGIKKGTQHMLFALATNVMIDWGFVIAAFVPLVLLWIFGEEHLRIVWRGSLALGCVPALFVFFWRLRMHEPVRFQKESMMHVPWKDFPVWLIVKRYWRRFTAIALAWFIYDFITYPFGIYSSTIVDTIIGSEAPLTAVLGWNVVINLFYIPGCMMGPGNCLGLLASKSSPTAFRGVFYGCAAAIGKIGAFAGTWAFPAIIARFPVGPKQDSGPFWIGSGLAVLSALITYFGIPEVPENHMTNEDIAFREYLTENGFDVSLMGTHNDEGALERNIAKGVDYEEATTVHSNEKMG
ncbi:hypothetical protein FRB96_007226 [Tulasnella sp. 330]|nr:hypothetical protein FRB96_007226 [Tulasnella sp. 330]KAG8869586.1 hypothetical protein FRB97_000998 [Tulasnella sp. 331]KAG8871527.1 hypothetical protein FRB98_000715 [Tulasnella sp. 332]